MYHSSSSFLHDGFGFGFGWGLTSINDEDDDCTGCARWLYTTIEIYTDSQDGRQESTTDVAENSA